MGRGFDLLIITLLVFSTFITASIWGPETEGRWNPPVTKLEISHAVEEVVKTSCSNCEQDIFKTTTLVWGHFTKTRNCEYKGVGWFLTEPDGGKTRLRVDNTEEGNVTPANYPKGEFNAGPWRIYASERDIRRRGVAILTHRCHPFYHTLTQWYP